MKRIRHSHASRQTPSVQRTSFRLPVLRLFHAAFRLRLVPPRQFIIHCVVVRLVISDTPLRELFMIETMIDAEILVWRSNYCWRPVMRMDE